MGLRRSIGFATVLGVLAALPASAGATTYTGLATGDDGAGCTIREAVDAAVNNAASGGCPAGEDEPAVDEIVLEAGDYSLTPVTTNENLNVNGDIDVGGGGPIVIRSDSDEIRDIGQGDINDRMFELVSGFADLTFRNVHLGTSGQIPAGFGGVINSGFAGAKLTLEGSEIVAGNDDINASFGGAIAIQGAGSELSISDSLIEGGNATDQGGAVYAASVDLLEITRSSFQFNGILDDTVGGDGSAGAILASSTPLTLTDSEITDNSVELTNAAADDGAGGGLVFQGTGGEQLTVKRSLIAENSVTSNGNPGTSEEAGGGLVVQHDGNAQIVNSTIYGNTAGNAPTDDSFGGGLVKSNTGTMDLRHVTFLANNATNSAGGDQIEGAGGGTTTYTASIIPGGGGVNPCEGPSLASGGHNALSPDAECPATGTGDSPTGVIGIVPGGPQDNGGLTPTVALDSSGTALDREPAALCATSSEGTDQRGYPRSGTTVGSACDAGAYERNVCNGQLLNGPGVFPGCAPLVAAPAPPAATTPKKKCKRKKAKKGAEAAKKKKCKKKRKK